MISNTRSIGIIVGVFILSGMSISSVQGQGRVGLDLSLDSPNVSLHEPVSGVFSLHNQLKDTIQVDLGPDSNAYFSFSITAPDGDIIEVPQLKFPPDGHVGAVGMFALKSGGIYRHSILLNEWYEFPTSGDYKVEIHLSAVARTKSGNPVAMGNGSPVVLHIGSRDENYLRKLCSEYAKSVVSSAPIEVRLDAAKELSFVRDPVAVPFLRQVLEQSPIEAGRVVKGLASIANAEAIDALIANLKTNNYYLKLEILQALIAASDRVTDEGIKARIQAVVPR